MFIAETLPELLTDRSHLLFEGVTGLAEAGIGFIAARVWIKFHDRKHHDHDCKRDDNADVQ